MIKNFIIKTLTDSKNINRLITALADNEIKNENEKKEILSLIENDGVLKFEFEIQSLMKNILKEKIGFSHIPLSLKKNIPGKIRPSFRKRSF
jgi:hypothetical protein